MAGEEKTQGMMKRLIAGAAERGFGPAVTQEARKRRDNPTEQDKPIGKGD